MRGVVRKIMPHFQVILTSDYIKLQSDIATLLLRNHHPSLAPSEVIQLVQCVKLRHEVNIRGEVAVHNAPNK
jgi:hypothetical protein